MSLNALENFPNRTGTAEHESPLDQIFNYVSCIMYQTFLESTTGKSQPRHMIPDRSSVH